MKYPLFFSMKKSLLSFQSQFEVITSQASYLRSLNILVHHFMNDWAMGSTDVLPQGDRHHLFSNIETVRKVEQK